MIEQIRQKIYPKDNALVYYSAEAYANSKHYSGIHTDSWKFFSAYIKGIMNRKNVDKIEVFSVGREHLTALLYRDDNKWVLEVDDVDNKTDGTT